METSEPPERDPDFPLYECRYCDRMFDDVDAIAAHVERSHYAEVLADVEVSDE